MTRMLTAVQPRDAVWHSVWLTLRLCCRSLCTSNLDAGDGCFNCMLEAGFACSGTPSVCEGVCACVMVCVRVCSCVFLVCVHLLACRVAVLSGSIGRAASCGNGVCEAFETCDCYEDCQCELDQWVTSTDVPCTTYYCSFDGVRGVVGPPEATQCTFSFDGDLVYGDDWGDAEAVTL